MNKSVLWKQVQMILSNLSALVTSLGKRITGAENSINDLGEKVDAVPDMIPKLNLVNGKAEGSARMVTAAEEDGEYQLGEGAVAIGDGTKASGQYSYAEGQYSNAAGDYAHAEGAGTASGNWSHAEGGGEAVGSNSHAEGGETVAYGRYSHAEGYQNWADGKYSHVEGRRNCAKGDYSHAEGAGDTIGVTITGAANATTYTIGFDSSIRVGMWVRYNSTFAEITAKPSNTSITVSNTLSSTAVSYGSATIYESIALGTGSHVEGGENYATGDYSHAEGRNTEASGAQAHTEGRETRAASENQHVQGKYNVEDTSNKYAHIVGNGTSDTARSNAHTLDWDGNAWFSGKVFIGGNSMDDGATELGAGGGGADWNANEGEPGYVLNRTHWVETVVGEIIPETTMVLENGMGVLTDPVALLSLDNTYTVTWNGAEYSCVCIANELDGIPCLSLGNISALEETGDTGEPFILSVFADETGVSLLGGYAIVISFDGGDGAVFKVEGATEVVHKLDEKFIPGSGNSFIKNGTASGSLRTFESAKEDDTYALGVAAFAEGKFTKASGEASHAEGNGTIASGEYSHAEGFGSEASGSGAHAEGNGTKAEGGLSHAEGLDTQATGGASHAEGGMTVASAPYSHAEGYRTVAASDMQHVQGQYNISDAAKKYAHIVGNGESDTKRSNAHTLDWNGNAWFAGTMEGTAVILTSPNGTRYKVTVDDSGALSAAKI